MIDEIVFLPGCVDEAGMYVEREESVLGVLAVRSSMSDYEEPVLRHCYYPVVLRAHRERYAHLIGRRVAYEANGRYVVAPGQSVTLLNGGQTTAIHRSAEPIPRPATRARTRYQRGRWEKYVSGKGWTPA